MSEDPSQPVITSEEGFVVKIKLLSNEVYEIPVSPTASVAQFKKLVHQKTQVPVERQRLVFSGKQLVDGTIGDYVKESGLTVHLIARSNTPPENTPNNPPTPPQQPPQQQQQPRPPQPPSQPQQPFGIFSMPNPFVAQPNLFNMPNQQGNPQQQPNPTIFAQNINSAVNNLMGSLGIRLAPPPNVPPQQQQSQQAQQAQQQQPQQAQQSQPRVVPAANLNSQMFQPLDQLQQSINRVVIMGEHSNVHANPRVNVINYLRRLQNNMLRFLPQLNRGIQLLQEGRTTHLPDLADIFDSLNASNAGAVQLIRTLNAEQPPQHHHHHHHQQPHVHGPGCNHPRPQQPPQQPQQPQQPPMELQEPQVSATIVIAENGGSNGQFSLQMTTNNPTNVQGESTIMNTLANFLQPGTGSAFNFANLFAQPQQAQQSQPLPQNVPQQPSEPQPPLAPQRNEPQNVQNVNNVRTEPPIPAQQPQPVAQQNPMGGINMMSIFNNLQQSGGMGALMGMSLGSMLEEEGQPTTVYSAILSPITGSEILACFTQKDFSFISRKRQQFREATLKAISVASSREDLANKYASDLEKMLMPAGSVRNEEVCRKRVGKILHKHIERVIGHFLDTSAELDLTNAVLAELKTMYCEAIEEIGKHSESIDSVFGNIKRGFVESFDQMIPGFSGMLYAIIERDLVRIYREYITQKQRRQEMSAEEAQDEADLLKRIEAEGKEDAEEMAAFEHSAFYPN